MKIHPTRAPHDQWAQSLLQAEPVLHEKLVNAGVAADEVPHMLCEVCRFLHLIAWSGRKLTPPLALDLAWHELILFTRTYDRFCNQHFGEFIHHQPGGTQAENHSQLKTTLKLYHLCFGPPPAFWGDHGYLSEAVACGSCEAVVHHQGV